jgi:Malectin domain
MMSGIKYQADPANQTDCVKRNIVEGVSGPDSTIYRTYRPNKLGEDGRSVSLNFTLPVTGDGWYALSLHMLAVYARKKKNLFSMRLNDYTILKDFNP